MRRSARLRLPHDRGRLTTTEKGGAPKSVFHDTLSPVATNPLPSRRLLAESSEQISYQRRSMGSARITGCERPECQRRWRFHSRSWRRHVRNWFGGVGGRRECGGHTRESSKIANKHEEGLICVNSQTWLFVIYPVDLTLGQQASLCTIRRIRHLRWWSRLWDRKERTRPRTPRARPRTRGGLHAECWPRRDRTEGGCPRVSAHGNPVVDAVGACVCALRARQQRH